MSARPLLPLLVAALALALAPTASADLADETALAEKYAPEVRLVEQLEECGPGEPYEPMDVDALFGDSTVALRGPWNAFDLVKIGPSADDLAGLFEYHLDFPGSALEPGCTYELWARRLTKGAEPAVYAHVATDPGAPGKLALQYWFFYAFNDFNNTHEGDWEMIQLVFDAADAEEALDEEPVEVGYSSHEGAERAAWDDDEKLEIVDGTHPVVYPAAGSHANKFTEALYLGSSAEAGVGCDDTRGPHSELRPAVLTIPSDRRGGRRRVPVDHLRGALGRAAEGVLQRADGPEHEDAVDDADRVVRGLARPELRGSDRRPPRDERHRLLLHRCREGLRGAERAPAEPDGDLSRHCRRPRADRVRGDQGDLDTASAAPDRASPYVGSDPVVRRRRCT